MVLDHEAHAAIGASVRNFGFVTVTSQERGAVRRRAMRTRDIWDEMAWERLRAAGADYAVDGVFDLLPVLDAIEARLRAG